MANGTVFWAGKELSTEEETALRRVVAALRRNGREGDAECMERFLPENLHKWTPDELEAGAHHGPWMSFDAELR
jgi:hypothetical protein